VTLFLSKRLIAVLLTDDVASEVFLNENSSVFLAQLWLRCSETLIIQRRSGALRL